MYELNEDTKNIDSFEDRVLKNVMHDFGIDISNKPDKINEKKSNDLLKRHILLGIYNELDSRENILSYFDDPNIDAGLATYAHRFIDEIQVLKFRISGHIHMNVNGNTKVDPNIYELLQVIDKKWNDFIKMILKSDDCKYMYGNITNVNDKTAE